QAWNVLALDGSNWQKIDLFNFQTDIEGRVVENISKRCGGFLRQLSLRGCLSVGDAAMRTFAQNCRNIENLNLNGCTKITDSTCISLSKFCSKLKFLDLTSCVTLTNNSLKAVSEGCRNLEHLNISWCDQMTKDGIEALVRGCGGLRALFLRGCTQLDDEALKHLHKHCPELMTINMQSCTLVSDEGLVSLCRGCHKLEILCLSGCSNITDASLTALGFNCPRLKILEGARCSHLTDAGFTVLARNCHELEKMDLEECILRKGTTNTKIPSTISVPRSVPALRRSRSGAFGVSAPALGAALLRFVQRFCAWCLVLCTWDSVLDAPRRSVHAPRRSTLWRLDARCTHLDARRLVHAPRRSALRRFDARCTYIDAWCVDASTLGARTSTLDASALRCSVHAPRRSVRRRLDARCTHLDASTLGACTSTLDASALRRSVHAPRRLAHRRLDARCTHLDARRFDARCTHLDARRFGARRLVRRRLAARCTRLDARCTHLDARRFDARYTHLDARRLALRRSVHAPRRATLWRFDAQCTHLDARRFGVRRSCIDASTLSARTTMSGFHRCVTCQAKLPANNPHDDCVSCLGLDHAASALADRAYCQLCAGFQTRTLRQRARKAVGGRSPSSGSSHTISAPPSSAFTPPVAAQPPRSPSSQLTAGQRSPARRTRERSRSPSSRGARPRRESRSRSRSPRRRRYSRSPRRGRRHQETSGVAELTSKMSQFMEVMMGQQSLLMTLANVVPRAPELPTGPVAGQPVVPPPVPHGQPQEVWDVDAVSRDASDAEPLFEEGTEPEVTSQHSEQDDPEVLDTNDPMWSVVERAARHLGVDWPASEPTRRSLFELPSAHTLQSRILPAFPDFIKEVQSTWGAPASTPATSRKAAAFNMHGASEAGLASFPPVGAAFAALVKAPTLSGLAKDPSCPNRQCRITEAHLKKGYAAATEAVRLSNVASLLTVYQAALLRDLPECPSAALRTELGTVAQLLVKLAQLNARAQGRSIASLVVARRQLWLSQARVQEPDKVPLLDAPISPGHTFGPAVEEMLQRSVKAREASQQLAKMWPSKPFQPRRPQERQWRRAPPQQQAQSRGSMTAPSGVSARGQPAFVTDNTLVQLSIHCPRLQALSLSHCELITDDGIRHLSNSTCGHERLQVVELDNCPLITDVTLEHLKSCPNLERIELYDCQQVTRLGIKRIRAHLPEIKVHAYFAPVTPPPSVGGSGQRLCRCCIIL
ncbi:UNVERIFIED_CONTAM: hypothetical protein FKN15_018888, partial [Acipenser sinensis]